MAAPTYTSATTGTTDAGGAWTHVGAAINANDVVILQILQDGTGAGEVTLDSMTASRRQALDGTDNTMTYIGAFQVGGTSLAVQHLWIGRHFGASFTCTYTGSNSGTDDIYIREYRFANVITEALGGTSLAAVIENVTGGATTTSTGTSATASDASVTTTGPDRLALNFLAINDDNAFAGFTGESGGTWTTQASYAASGGTDGAIYLIDAAMASAGTIDGGTGSITASDAWGVIGFALIGTTVGGVARGHGQAQAQIKNTYRGHGQAQADIKQTYVAHAQAQASIKNTYFGLGQAQALIPINAGYGQAAAKIDENNRMTIRQKISGSIGTTDGSVIATLHLPPDEDSLLVLVGAGDNAGPGITTGFGRDWVYSGFEVVHAGMIARTFYSGLPDASDLVSAEVTCDFEATFTIYEITNAHQTEFHTDGAGDTAQTIHGVPPFDDFNVGDNNGRQFWALAGWTFDFLSDEPSSPDVYNEDFRINEPPLLSIYGSNKSYEGDFVSTSGTEDSVNIVFYVFQRPMAVGQAQALIEAGIGRGYGQAQARIKNTYFGLGQSQAYIILSGQNAHGQAQAWIENTYFGLGQAQAQMLAFDVPQSGQAQARIVILIAQDNFQRTVAQGWGTSTPDGSIVWFTEPDDGFAIGEGSVNGSEGLTDIDRDLQTYGAYPDTFDGGYPLLARGIVQYDLYIPSAAVTSADYNMDSLQNGIQVVQTGGNWEVRTVFDSAISIPFTPEDSTWYTVKYWAGITGDTIYAKIWKRGDPEPAWQDSGVQTAGISPGYWYIEGNTVEPARVDNVFFFNAENFLLRRVAGHAQAFIHRTQGYGLAQAVITGGFDSVDDLFERTVSNGVGTADIGGDYTLTQGTGTQWDVDGSKLVYTASTTTDSRQVLKSVYTGRPAYEVKLDFRVASFGTGSGFFTIYPYVGTSLSAVTTGVGGRIVITNSSGEIQLAVRRGTSNTTLQDAGTVAINELWHFKGHFQQTSFSNGFVRVKVWRDGDTEPGWLTSGRVDTHPAFLGSPGIGIDAGNTTNVLDIEYFNVTSIGWTESGQAQAYIQSSTYVHGQAQADIKQVYFGLGQAQSQIKQVYFGLGQAQSQIKQVYFGLGQSNALIVRSEYAHGQAEAWIENTYFGLGQSQAQIKQVYFGLGQSQADIKQVYFGLGQAQGTILQSYTQHGQAQGTILTNYVQHGQAQADIKATANIHGQAQADIKQVYSVHGQAQADIKQVYFAHGQANAWIEQTYFGLGQAQGTILQTYAQHGQAQADILQTYNQHGQSQGTIKNAYFGLAQAQATILQIYFVSGQAQAKINSFGVCQFGQAQGNVKAEGNFGHAQAQAKINAFDYSQHGQAQASIEATYNSSGQAQADILAVYTAFAQSQAWIEQTYNQHGQSQGTILTTYYAHGQAQAYIILIGQNGYGQAQGNIRNTYFGCGQAQAKINAFDVIACGQAEAYIQSGVVVHGQSQGAIKAVGFGLGQAQANIEQTYNGHGQAQSDIKQTYTQSGQANALIAQTAAVCGQAQGWIETTYTNCGQAQGQIKQTYVAHAQAQALIKNTYTQSGQSSAYILLIESGYGQAQGAIKATSSNHGQAQGTILQVYPMSGNAQSLIKATINSYAQAQGAITNTYTQNGNAQALITSGTAGYGQAQADILQTYLVFAQAAAAIIKAAGYGQAQALVRVIFFFGNLELSDSNPVNLSLSDSAEVDGSLEDTGQPELSLSDTNIGLNLSDTGIDLTLSDSNY